VSTVRPRIAFFNYSDVFEDFCPHYGVDQRAFVTTWAATGNHAFLRLIQNEIGDVTWYELSIDPELTEAVHEQLGFRVRFVRSSWLHRRLWRAFYLPRPAWRWQRLYPAYALVASYAAPLSAELRKVLGQDGPDVIVTQEYSTGKFDVLLAMAKRLGIPLIARHAGSSPDRYVGRLTKRWTIRRADLLLASSAAERETLVERLRVPAERVSVVLTPIDTEAFRPLERTEACEASGLDPDRRYLLFVGRLDDRVKRVAALIEAFAGLAPRTPDLDLLVVGEGRDGPRLRELSDRLAPGRVRFLGWVSGADRLAPLYGSADCLVLPSRTEGFPTVVGEAMACGTPVLGSRVGGVPELVVEGETGWLVEPGDDSALAERLRQVIEHRERVRDMRSHARRVAEERIAPAVVGAQLREAFDRVLAR
jgi:glycosyltransferase involved in cell wall biosynthesis